MSLFYCVHFTRRLKAGENERKTVSGTEETDKFSTYFWIWTKIESVIKSHTHRSAIQIFTYLFLYHSVSVCEHIWNKYEIKKRSQSFCQLTVLRLIKNDTKWMSDQITPYCYNSFWNPYIDFDMCVFRTYWTETSASLLLVQNRLKQAKHDI